jgi:hypothetical protein
MSGDDRSKAWQAVGDHSRLGVDWERGRVTEDFGFTMQQFRAGQTWANKPAKQSQKDGLGGWQRRIECLGGLVWWTKPIGMLQ